MTPLEPTNIVPTGNPDSPLPRAEVVSGTQQSLTERLFSGGNDKYGRFILAALSSVPGIGLLAALSSLKGENDQDEVNQLVRLWLVEQQDRLVLFGGDLQEIITRLDSLGPEIDARIHSDGYLALVRQTFRSWDQADTQEKRQMYKKLITNAAAISLSEDDTVRLFINWISLYHESHFMVIREIYKKPGITRAEMWDRNNSTRPREDSAEADLFKYLIRELSTGGVIRQKREVTASGQFERSKPQTSRKGSTSSTMETAFEGTKEYVLTGLGEKFVHYVMQDVAPQLQQGRQGL